MNSKTALQLKSELLTKKGNLITLQLQNQKMEGEQEASKDVIDRSDVEEAWFTKERMSQHWKLELNQVQSALQKIEDGSFGVCEECEDEIPLKRLRVRPDATLCLNCQESMEREMGQMQKGARPATSSPFDLMQ